MVSFAKQYVLFCAVPSAGGYGFTEITIAVLIGRGSDKRWSDVWKDMSPTWTIMAKISVDDYGHLEQQNILYDNRIFVNLL